MMPAIIKSTVKFDESKGYYVDLCNLVEIFPHLEKDKEVEIYIVELRNEQDKLVKRFKPFRKILLKIDTYWDNVRKQQTPCLSISKDHALELNIGKNYKMTIVITKYDGKSFLPLEIKVVGYYSEKALELFSKIEADLISLSIENASLNKIVSYLWDAYFRLEENDVEGARTALRNSLDILRKEFLSKIIVPEKSEETGDLPQRLRELVKNMIKFLHYGGPHPGPAPRTTTETIISLTIELLRYLSRAMEKNILIFHEGEQE